MSEVKFYKLVVAYDGTDYCGWQVQLGQPTVQGMLQQAMARVVKERVSITGSGRTDSGVHALGQVASLETAAWTGPAEKLALALNSKLPADIRVLSSQQMPGDFHAIRDARGKRYRYQLQIGGIQDPFEFRYRYYFFAPVDVAAMRAAAQHLLGTHDFAAFQAAGSERKTTVRTVRDLVIHQEQGRGGCQGLAIEVEANGFLYNMVRNIVGSLLHVGRGQAPPEWIAEVRDAKNRDLAGPTAPPQGLFLMHVQYD